LKSIKINLDPELSRMIEVVRQHFGVKNYSETVRILIKKEYEAIRETKRKIEVEAVSGGAPL